MKAQKSRDSYTPAWASFRRVKAREVDIFAVASCLGGTWVRDNRERQPDCLRRQTGSGDRSVARWLTRTSAAGGWRMRSRYSRPRRCRRHRSCGCHTVIRTTCTRDRCSLFKQRRILLADHVGGRIARDLRGGGFDVTVLKDNVWCALSERIRVMTLADYNQDSVLLVDVGGRLVVDLNDATEKGWGGRLRRLIKQYPISIRAPSQRVWGRRHDQFRGREWRPSQEWTGVAEGARLSGGRPDRPVDGHLRSAFFRAF